MLESSITKASIRNKLCLGKGFPRNLTKNQNLAPSSWHYALDHLDKVLNHEQWHKSKSMTLYLEEAYGLRQGNLGTVD